MNKSTVINYDQLAPEKYFEERKELEKIKNESSIAMDIQDSNRLNRLVKYESLSEFQLENDYIYYKDEELVKSYLKLLWDTFGTHIQNLKNADAIFEDLEELDTVDVKIKTVCDYNRYFLDRVLDEENFFDGIDLKKAVDHFNDTSFAAEISKLSKKYRLSIPKYWTKNDLKIRFKTALKERNELTQEIIDRIESCNVKKLRLLMDEYNVDSKLHITKRDMINLIIKNVDINKVSDVAKEEVVNLEVEEVVETKEEIVEEAQTEKATLLDSVPVGAPIVLPEPKDYEELLKQIIMNQEIIIKQNSEGNNAPDQKDGFLQSKFFNFSIFIMIIIVVAIWIYYGFTTLF